MASREQHCRDHTGTGGGQMVRILSPQSAWPASGMGLHARGNERIFTLSAPWYIGERT